MEFYYYSIFAGIVALVVAVVAAFLVLQEGEGTEKMKEIANAIREGSDAYLKRQLKTIVAFAVILSILFAFMHSGLSIVLAFVVGAVTSYLTAYLGMTIAVRTNIRTAKSAERGLDEAFKTAILGGSVTGFAAVGFSLIGLGALLAYFTTLQIPLLIGFAFGASLISLFARVGGGIFTKAADVGADLVGKTELNLPEDDVRNPATIADNVGDNVGDCAGMAADVFESYSVTLVAALLIASSIANAPQSLFSYPIFISALGIVGSVVGIFFVGKIKGGNVTGNLYRSIFTTVVIAAILDVIATMWLGLPMIYFVPVLSGLILAFLLFWVSDYYTGGGSKPVVKIATAAKGGAGTNVIMGLAVGLRSTWLPALFVVGAILVSYAAAGVYGIAIAAAGMFSLTATILTIDSFGPITDNAGGIAEMAHLSPKVRSITDKLDAVGNTTKATTKGFAIGGAALSAIALFVAFAHAVNITVIDALNPLVMCGIIVGALLPFIFSSFLMEAVGHAANLMVEEVRRQVKTIKGLMQGKAKPDYARAVDIATVNALKSLALPELIAILTPIIIGLALGPQALGGLLVGMIPASFMLALFMANSGGAMDNAKKYIESGHFGGKGSDAHKAAVVGDTLGDPLKDTAGPALNSMIKVVSTISILLAPVFVMFALIH
ncbi:MAG TPA: sodium-translocating pyrophosphatase [Candidatus Saccharimonadales bacterium]|nr:sodium-translocating pyrophosphatase [Candidatus Saccharimonadales bacterium]